MRALITGAFGCIGGRLAQHLSAGGGTEVLLGTRHQMTSPHWLPGARVVRIDWNSPEKLREACEGVDSIVHLAGMNAQDSSANPEGALEFNGAATGRLVRAAGDAGVKRLIYFSTAHVYRSPLVGRISESSPTTNPHPYAVSHLAGERAVLEGAGAEGVVRSVIRLSNSYGAPAHKDANCWMLLVNDLCRQAVTLKKMTLKTSGVQRRDFIPLSDVSAAVPHLLTVSSEKAAGRIFNLGGDWTPTVWEMAGLIQERCAAVLGFNPALVRVEPASGEMSAELRFLSDAIRATGFEPAGDKIGEIEDLLRFCSRNFQ